MDQTDQPDLDQEIEDEVVDGVAGEEVRDVHGAVLPYAVDPVHGGAPG